MSGAGSLPVGCLAWQDPVLESPGSVVGPTVTPQRACADSHFLKRLLPVHSSPERAPATHSAGEPLTLAGRFGSISCGVTAAFLWVKSHWPSKPDFPVDPQSLFQIPMLGSLMWGSGPSQQWADFCGTTALLFAGHPSSGCAVWFYRDCTPPTVSLWILLRLCSCTQRKQLPRWKDNPQIGRKYLQMMRPKRD